MSSHKKNASKRKSDARPAVQPSAESRQNAPQIEQPEPSVLQQKLFPLAVRTAFFLFMFWFWAIRYRDLLYMSQEYDLFVWEQAYLADAASRIVGLGRYLSSFLLQFFYNPILGGLMMAGAASFIQYSFEKLCGLRRWGFFLSFVPPCLLAIQITNVNFFLFERFDTAYLFGFTFSYVFALAFALVYDSLKTPRSRTVFFVAATLLTFPVFGFFTLLASFLCLLKETPRLARSETSSEKESVKKPASKEPGKGRRNGKPRNPQVERFELLALFALLVPVLYWPFFSNTTPTLRYMYAAGLWEESALTQGRETSTSVVFNLCSTLTLTTIILAAIADAFRSRKAARSLKSGKARPESRKRFNVRVVFSCVLTILVCSITVNASFASPNFLMLLKIARALDKEDWNGVLTAESRIATPSNPAITARTLALARQNRLADEIFARPVYPKTSPQLQTVQTFGMCGDRMLYEFGIVNGAERAAFNNYVAKRERTYWGLKTLALCAIADGRRSLAERYLYRVRKTLFHREFAEEMLDYLAQNDAVHGPYAHYSTPRRKTSEKRLSEIAESVDAVRKLLPLEDKLEASETVNSILYGMLQHEDLSRRELPEQENRLAFLLLMRNLPAFGKNFDEYVKQKGDQPLPKSLQEAALLREQLPNIFDANGADKWSIPDTVIIDPAIRERFNQYLEMVNRAGANTPEGAAETRAVFGDSFWFFISIPQKIENY